MEVDQFIMVADESSFMIILLTNTKNSQLKISCLIIEIIEADFAPDLLTLLMWLLIYLSGPQ